MGRLQGNQLISATAQGVNTMQDIDYTIEQLLNTKTREAIIESINQYGDAIQWDGYTTREILDEVARSDSEAGEEYNGILAGIASELL